MKVYFSYLCIRNPPDHGVLGVNYLCMVIKFDSNTNYSEVESEVWGMMSSIAADKCGCNKASSAEYTKACNLMTVALWEKTNKPSRYIRTIKTTYYLLYQLQKR